MYLYFLVLNALEMCGEVLISVRNSRELLKKGAVEIAPALLPIMAAIYFVMFVGSALEWMLIPRQFSALWVCFFAVIFVLAKLLKFWAVRSLGPFWTMRVLILPEANVVTRGPYRWIKHPNYVAVLMEIAATPLIAKCFYTFTFVILAFSVTLVLRIKREEAALRRYTDYGDQMDRRGRFLP